MSDQAVLLPKWCAPRGIILGKGQLGHSHTFWIMSIMISSAVANFGYHPLFSRKKVQGNTFSNFSSTYHTFDYSIIISKLAWIPVWQYCAQWWVWNQFHCEPTSTKKWNIKNLPFMAKNIAHEYMARG